MAASLVGGAALGAPFGELLKLVLALGKQLKTFKSSFTELESTLVRLKPIVEAIDSSHNSLGLRKDELEILWGLFEKAQVLISKCLEVWKIDVFRRVRYSREIKEINNDLLKYCQIDMQLQQSSKQLQMMKDIKELKNEMCRNDFVGLCSPPEPKAVTVGLDRPLKELKNMLFDEEISAIVVSAPPGCGKTTLVTKLCHDEEVKGKFESIFHVFVSKNPDMRYIVQNILQHNGLAIPTLKGDQEAIQYLKQHLKRIGESSSILLVLDDVWPGPKSKLWDFKFQIPNCKILVTSRCNDLGFGSIYRLETLKYEDARILFIEKAGQPDDISPAEYEDLLQKILKSCNGHPLAIEVVGSTLKNRPVFTWKTWATSLFEGGKKILDLTGPDLLECLQTSVDALDAGLKECFADLGSFPVDYYIRAAILVDVWAELYGLDKDGLQAMKFLDILASQNLLRLFHGPMDGHEDGFYNEYYVTQHHVLRELAIHQSELATVEERKRLNMEILGDRFPDWCLNLRQPSNARILSIYTDASFSSKWCDMNPSMVEALILYSFSVDYALPGFIANMERLKVLMFINRQHTSHANVSNLSCINSSSNLKRIRFEGVSIALDFGQLQLKSLQKLSFALCGFSEIFYDFQIDVCSALPSLQEIDMDYCELKELPCWICEVKSLRKLSLSESTQLSELPQAIGKLSNLEVLRLTFCISLCELPETVDGLKKLCYLDICSCESLKKLPPQIGTLQSLKKIFMRGCWSCELPPSIQNLKGLKEVRCDEQTAFRWEQFKPSLVDLEINVNETEPCLEWVRLFWV